MADDKMTIDGLARLMQDEFLGVNKRFDGVDKRWMGMISGSTVLRDAWMPWRPM